MKILAIDDNPDNLIVLKAVLLDSLPKAVLQTALDGKKGFQLAAAEDPDVILLDIVMPGLDGYQVCRQLKADPRLKSIPVVFLTAHADRDSRIKAVEAGADGFLPKPFDEIELSVQILAMGKLKAANRTQRMEKDLLARLVAERTHELQQELVLRKQAEEDLKKALESAESANRAKSEFLAVMSHELRTPLNGILGFAELLTTTPLDREQREYAQTISKSGTHLLSLVNDILDFSSIEKGRLRLESAPVALAPLLDSASLPIQKLAAEKGIVFRSEPAPDIPERITGDGRRICQILMNLLNNAVKFTSEGSVVLRAAPAVAEGRPCLDFSVSDTGMGIPEHLISYLFEPFTQAESTLNRRFDGTGLGLAISKRLAEAMEGSITVESSPGKGSTFTLRLPMGEVPSPEPAARPEPPSPPEARSAGNLVLVVEDDLDNSLLERAMLKAIGYRAETSFHGKEALESFAPRKFSAILMDMQMPIMDGLTATKKIREIEVNAGGRVPIIALTANVMPGDRERCLAAGMDEFLTKPFKKAELAQKLASLVPANPPTNQPS